MGVTLVDMDVKYIHLCIYIEYSVFVYKVVF